MQCHREIKTDTTRPPTTTSAAQQRRFRKRLRICNHPRQHKALGLHVPAALSHRRRPRYRGVRPSRYPGAWTDKRVRTKGKIYWEERSWFLDELSVRKRPSCAAPGATGSLARLLQRMVSRRNPRGRLGRDACSYLSPPKKQKRRRCPSPHA